MFAAVGRRQVVLALAVEHNKTPLGGKDQALTLDRPTRQARHVEHDHATRRAGFQPRHQPLPVGTPHARVPRRAPAIDVHLTDLRPTLFDPGLAVLDLAPGRALPIVTKSRHARVDVKNKCHRGSSRHGVTYYTLTPAISV